nr:MAG TPA: hypothetical protein [Caudoviricetes sp.]
MWLSPTCSATRWDGSAHRGCASPPRLEDCSPERRTAVK